MKKLRYFLYIALTLPGLLLDFTVSKAQVLLQAPTELKAEGVAYNRVNLSWKDNSGDQESGFEIYRDPGLGTNFTLLATVDRNVTSYEDRSVSPLSTYNYRVRAISRGQQSRYSNDASASTPEAPPQSPGDLIARVNGLNVNLTWNGNNGGGTRFILERANMTEGTAFRQIAVVEYSRSLAYEDRSLSPATTYCYRVMAVNNSGTSGYSNTACADIASLVPTAPARLNAVAVSESSIELTWADISDNETGFELQRSADGSAFSKLTDIGSGKSSYQDNGLAKRTRYWYRIRAFNANGSSGFSNVAEATTLDVPPAKPADLTATTISSNQINLQWKDQSDNETGFELERSGNGSDFQKIADLNENATTFENRDLQPATKYWYRVRSRNNSGISGFSNVASATTPDVVPVTPGRLNATAVSYQQIDLTWEDLSGNEKGFQLEWSDNGTSFTKLADLGENVKNYQHKGLKSETRYYYRIRAVNAVGASGYSNVAEAVTGKAPIPDKPENLTAVPLDFDLVQLRWSPLSANATEVIIERSQKPGSEFRQIGRQAASNIQFADREILDVKDYYYRIKAINAAGSSGYSNVAKIFASSIITAVEPSSEELIYVFEKTLFVSSAKSAHAMVTIYDLQGKSRARFLAASNSRTDLSGFSTGVYILVVELNEKKTVRQKIVMH
ncbi:fibronectin type III domain-containing protein [Dyadobacter sp. Leaf189]|uniref:fibronectin type III domain-containing protein n=1 Tax=Dyadobacter sp. Leaf189 TaxID=1736295 RepID=UPI0007014514|nr:fibronectin type III domain-containing protein [Dyadobacter sp. Leaf189]KQS34059.1 hypothetical protein ASG33_08555 [Dyadobacter sp. Leaf189]